MYRSKSQLTEPPNAYGSFQYKSKIYPARLILTQRPKVTKSILAKAFNSSLDDIIPQLVSWINDVQSRLGNDEADAPIVAVSDGHQGQ